MPSPATRSSLASKLALQLSRVQVGLLARDQSIAALDHVDAVDLDPCSSIAQGLPVDLDRAFDRAGHAGLEHPEPLADMQGPLREVDVREQGDIPREGFPDRLLALGADGAGGVGDETQSSACRSMIASRSWQFQASP